MNENPFAQMPPEEMLMDHYQEFELPQQHDYYQDFEPCVQQQLNYEYQPSSLPQNASKKTSLTHRPVPKKSSLTLTHHPQIRAKINDPNAKPTFSLPSRFHHFFSFPSFNRMQSECFDIFFHSESHAVVSSPTGSGKTVLLELAILQLLSNPNGEHSKVVYIAPMKALCHERAQDWKKKFAYLNYTCNELTGDTDFSQMTEIQRSNIMYCFLNPVSPRLKNGIQ